MLLSLAFVSCDIGSSDHQITEAAVVRYDANGAESGSYLHITGLTERGKQLAELAITETIDGLSVTSIQSGAFRGCSKVKTVTIAGSVRSIGDSAFAGCNNLKTLIMKGEDPPDMGVGVLEFCPAVISVPSEAKEAYSNKAGLI